MGLFPKRLTSGQRTKIKLAKINQKTGKSAISEIGKTVRNVAANITAAKTYQTHAAAKVAEQEAKQQAAKENTDNLAKALSLYNQLFDGNADQAGNKGDASTTEVGGAGSAIGG